MKYTKIESYITEFSKSINDSDLAELAELSYLARKEIWNTPESIIASDYIAPTYIAYVETIIRKCKELGIHKLQFLSRDGYILYEIAKALNQSDIELGYFFASRKSLIRPYLANGDPKEKFLTIIDGNTLISRHVDFLLDKLSISKSILVTIKK